MKSVVLFVTFLCLHCGTAEQLQGFNTSLQVFDDLVHSFEYWQRILTQVDLSAFAGKHQLHKFISYVKPSSSSYVSHKLISSLHSATNLLQSQCSMDIEYLLENLEKEWAFELLDANAKMPSGMMLGNFLWTGSYRECREAYAPPSNDSLRGNFHGHYCSAVWSIALPRNMPLRELPLRTGICIPETCNSAATRNNIQSILKFLERAPFLKHLSETMTLDSLDCKLDFQKPDEAAILFLAILGAIASVAVFASAVTIFDHVQIMRSKLYQRLKSLTNGSVSVERDLNGRNIITEEDQIPVLIPYELDDAHQPYLTRVTGPSPDDSCWWRICCNTCNVASIKKCLKCFCLFTNGAKLLDTESSSENLSCIHGIRFLSMSWVILGHTYVHSIYTVENSVDVLKDADNWPFQVLMQATFAVDSFFLISGFLLAYLYLNEADKRRGKINWFGLCLHRYVRLTPVYAVLIGFDTLVFDYTGSGPFWHETSDAENCQKYWWWNVLYINNFVPIRSTCVTWTWYLANEMQFFVLCSSFLYILWRWPKYGLSIFCSLLLSSWVITWLISEVHHMPPFFYGMTQMQNYTAFQEEVYNSWDLVYSKPYCRIGPYIIGIILAYILYKGGRKPILKRWMLVTGWMTAAFCCLSVIYGLYHVPYIQELFNVYNALSRSAFTLGLAWVIYACLTGYGGPANWILSRKTCIPLSRMTYCAYLFHPLIMTWYFQSRKVPLYFSHETTVLYFLGFMTVSYAVAFVISLLFETPVINLEKHLLKSRNCA